MGTIYKCPKCGSTECQITAWVTVNGEDIIGTWNEGPSDDTWCPECEEHFSYKRLVEVCDHENTHQCETGDPGCLHCDDCDAIVAGPGADSGE